MLEKIVLLVLAAVILTICVGAYGQKRLIRRLAKPGCRACSGEGLTGGSDFTTEVCSCVYEDPRWRGFFSW